MTLASIPPAHPGLKHDPEWFKTAVFYEVLVRAFGDSTGSGTGDNHNKPAPTAASTAADRPDTATERRHGGPAVSAPSARRNDSW